MASLTSRINFVLQQGLEAPPAESCSIAYSALHFQPRVVAAVALLGTILQSPAVFLSLAVLLGWSALFPRWNPLDAIYNQLFATRSGFRLQPAPPPRRFAQVVAALFSAIIGMLLMLGFRVAAFVMEAILLAAIGALVFGGFCLGSYVFHLLKGRRTFANRTLPWSLPAPPDSA